MFKGENRFLVSDLTNVQVRLSLVNYFKMVWEETPLEVKMGFGPPKFLSFQIMEHIVHDYL